MHKLLLNIRPGFVYNTLRIIIIIIFLIYSTSISTLNLVHASPLDAAISTSGDKNGKNGDEKESIYDTSPIKPVKKENNRKIEPRSGSSHDSSYRFEEYGKQFDLELKILAAPNVINRTEIFMATYNLSNPYEENLKNIKFCHDLPSYFKIIDTYGDCNISNSSSLTFNCSKLNTSDFVSFGYNATVTKDAKISKYKFNDGLKFSADKIEKGKIILDENSSVEIRNNKPSITGVFFEINGERDYPPTENNTYDLSMKDQITLIGNVNDIEDEESKLKYSWISGEETFAYGNGTQLLSGMINYSNITLIVSDKEGEFDIERTNKTIIIKYHDRWEYFRELVPFAIIFMAIMFIFINRLKFWLANGYNSIYVMLILIWMYLVYFLVHEGQARTTGILELFILLLTIIFSNKFIISSFRDSSHKLWYIANFCMTLVVAILIIIVPLIEDAYSQSSYLPDLELRNGKEDIIFSYFFYYYSMMTQTFGAIVAIIAMIATSKIGDSQNMSKDSLDNLKIKIKNFLFLYISIIILSIIGLATRALPPLKQYELSPTILIFPLFIFEATLLLSIPALIYLIKLILDFYDFMREEKDRPISQPPSDP